MVKGIVVDGTRAGNPTGSQNEAIKRAQTKGVIVVLTARVHGGRVQETPRRTTSQLINGDNMEPVSKAEDILRKVLFFMIKTFI